MISKARALELMQESATDLRRSGMIDHDLTVGSETPLLGADSQLDSMGFVTFITDLEDRLTRETGTDVQLVLDDVHDFNADQPYLSGGTLARYLGRITGGDGAATR